MNRNRYRQDLSETKQANLASTDIALVALASCFIGLRFLSRWKKRAYIGIDDYFIVIAYIFLLGLLSIGLLMIHNGLGLHAAALPTLSLITVGKSLLAFECVYVTTVCFTKLSLLLMYVRILPMRSMRIGCWILGAISICWAISIILVCIFQCGPIAKAWNPVIPGKCINLKGSFIGNAVPNILTDVAILTLPIPHIWGLRTTAVQRVQLCVVFLLGSFVVFTSIYRFTTLFQFVPADLTWTLAKACTWCIVESSAGIISACLPTLAPLLRSTNFTPWRAKSKSSSSNSTRSVKEIITIGGNEGRRKGFERLDARELRDGDMELIENRKLGGRAYHSENRHGLRVIGMGGMDNGKNGQSGDMIPLQGIQQSLVLEWGEERG